MRGSSQLSYMNDAERAAFIDPSGKPSPLGAKLVAEEKKKRIYGGLAIAFGVIGGLAVGAIAVAVIRNGMRARAITGV